jgi:hypothetical protein
MEKEEEVLVRVHQAGGSPRGRASRLRGRRAESRAGSRAGEGRREEGEGRREEGGGPDQAAAQARLMQTGGPSIVFTLPSRGVNSL